MKVKTHGLVHQLLEHFWYLIMEDLVRKWTIKSTNLGESNNAGSEVIHSTSIFN